MKNKFKVSIVLVFSFIFFAQHYAMANVAETCLADSENCIRTERRLIFISNVQDRNDLVLTNNIDQSLETRNNDGEVYHNSALYDLSKLPVHGDGGSTLTYVASEYSAYIFNYDTNENSSFFANIYLCPSHVEFTSDSSLETGCDLKPDLLDNIADSNTIVVGSMGFGVLDLLSFMKDQFLFVMGGGLGMLQGLIVFILILAVATAVIYSLYRAFIFFRK